MGVTELRATSAWMATSSLVRVVILRSTGSFSLQEANTTKERISALLIDWNAEFRLGMGLGELTA
jgi:hypothetical protein